MVDSPYSCLTGNIQDASLLHTPTHVPHCDASPEDPWFDDHSDDHRYLHNEWKLRRYQFYNDGYREGTIEGQRHAAQDAFNLGFKDSVMPGYNWGILRGLTRGLAHLPDKLKEKILEKEHVRKELLNLHSDVESMATEDALKLFYHNINKAKSAELNSSHDSNSVASLTNQSYTVGLETYVGKLELLLKESCDINVSFELIESVAS